MAPTAGELITEQLDYDDGRLVTVFRPPEPAEAVVFAADGGWHVPRLADVLGSASAPPIMIVGVHGLPDDDDRLKEYVPGFDARRFTAHERFFVGGVGRWVATRFGVALPAAQWPRPLPRVYLVAGRDEPFFLANATRWADALRDAHADVAMVERDGEHGGAFWAEEFPPMVAWAFGP